MDKSIDQYVGIDVSKKRLDVYIHPLGVKGSYANTPKGFDDLVVWLHRHRVVHVIAEATGGLELGVLEALHERGYKVSRVNPRWIKDFTRACGKIAKTDVLDSAQIALYGCRMSPEAYIPAGRDEQALKGLTARRRQLMKTLTMETNRLKQARMAYVIRLIQEEIRSLKEKIQDIEQVIDAILLSNDTCQRKREIIESIPGVGSVTAATLIAELPELGTLTGKQVAAMAGVCPFNRDSGTLKGYRMIFGGREHARQALYMASLGAATRHNPVLKAFYDALIARGKTAKVALIAVARKLIVTINAMIKHGKMWEERATAIT